MFPVIFGILCRSQPAPGDCWESREAAKLFPRESMVCRWRSV